MIPDSKTLLYNIKRKTPYLNPALQRIAVFISENPEKIKLLKIKKLASNCEVSEATVTRFVKEFNINTFQELKIILADVQSRDPTISKKVMKFVYDDVTKGDSTDNVIEKLPTAILRPWRTQKKLLILQKLKKRLQQSINQKLLLSIVLEHLR
jgi:DNA-binding MurR/RpiR family transcriptional regulator